MSPQKRLGDGNVIDVDFDVHADDPDRRRLENEVRRLDRELADAKRETARVREDSTRALAALRQNLGPLYRALQMVFGELDAAGVEEPGRPAPTMNSDAAYWEEWKKRLDPVCGKVIDALMLGGQMSVRALEVACHMRRTSIYQATAKMGRAGIVVKSGGKFALRRS